MIKLTRSARISFAACALAALGPGAAPALAGLGDRELGPGRKGDDVRELQTILAGLGFDQPVTGFFGPLTEAAVKEWERKQGRDVDGVVAPNEANRLRRAARNSPRSAPGKLQPTGGSSPAPAPSPSGPGAGGPIDQGPIRSVPVSSAGYAFPVRGPHSFGSAINRFGAPRAGHSHRGHDVMAPAGTPVVAARGGVVTHRAFQGAAGNYLVIHADDGNDHVYMHFQAPAIVAVGERVRAGQGVGRVGCTGSCTGPHLHFELWAGRWFAGGGAVDPLPNLQAWDAAS